MFRNNKELNIKPSKYDIYILWNYPIICLYIFILWIFIPNSYIESSSFLVELSSIFDDILPAIENTANISYHYGLYYKMKLSLVLGIFIGVIMFLPTLYFFSKIYLSSLGIIKSSNKKYISKYILKSPAYFGRFILSILGFLFIFLINDFLYFSSTYSNIFYLNKLYYGTNFIMSIFIIQGLFFSIMCFIVYSLEVIAYFYKLKNRDKFLSKEEFEIYFIVNERYKKEIQSRYKKTFFQKFKNMLLLREYDEKIFENISTQEEKEIKEKIQKEVKLELEKKREKKGKKN